jgi:hypothetical protein
MFEASDYKVKAFNGSWAVIDMADDVIVDPIWMWKEIDKEVEGFVINVPEQFRHWKQFQPDANGEFQFDRYGSSPAVWFVSKKDAQLFRLWLVHHASECSTRCQFCRPVERAEAREPIKACREVRS